MTLTAYAYPVRDFFTSLRKDLPDVKGTTIRQEMDQGSFQEKGIDRERSGPPLF